MAIISHRTRPLAIAAAVRRKKHHLTALPVRASLTRVMPAIDLHAGSGVNDHAQF